MVLRQRFGVQLMLMLRGQRFRRLLATRLSSQFADGAFEAALAGLFFFSPQRAATATGIAAAIAVVTLPYTVVGPFAGLLLDHWRRRQVLVVVNLARAVLVVGVGGLVAHGAVGPPLYVIVLTCLSLNRFFLCGLSAGLPNVVQVHDLVPANAISTTSGTLVAILGSGAAFGVRSLFGASNDTDALLLALTALSYACSAALALRIGASWLGPDAVPPSQISTVDLTVDLTQSSAERRSTSGYAHLIRAVASGLTDAGRHLRQCPDAAAALLVLAGQRFGYGLITVATFLLCRATYAHPDNLSGGALRLGGVVAVSGAGVVSAALITPIGTRRLRKPTWILLGSLAATLAAVAFTIAPTYPMLLSCGFVLAIALQSSKICVDSILQEQVADTYLGRVMSLYDMAYNLSFVVAAGACALVLPPSGRSPGLFALVSATFAAAGIGYALCLRRRPGITPAPDQIDLRDTEAPTTQTRTTQTRTARAGSAQAGPGGGQAPGAAGGSGATPVG